MQPAESPAKIYQQHMVPAIFVPWVPIVLDLASPQLDDRMLDVACGTGVIAREAVSQVGPGGRVVGLDINSNMLDIARGVEVRDDAMTALVRDVEAALRTYVHPDGLAFPMEAHLALARA